jgi:hypothetical protein
MIVVTGMHRSGTSLVCQLLAGSGVSFGAAAEQYPGDRWNPAGYFELRAVLDTNSRIVTGLPRTGSRLLAWASKLVYLCQPGADAMAARARRQQATIVALGQRCRDGAVKDPRFCLTLRFWLQWAAVRQVVVCLRHPNGVLASLARRDRLPRRLAARFYAYHVDALLAQLPAERTRFVDVDRLAAGDAGELDTLRRGLGLSLLPPAATLLHAVVRPDGYAADAAMTAATPPVAAAAWQRLLARSTAQRQQPAAPAGSG